MKTLHSFVAGFRPASLILARRVALPLLLLGAGLVGVQPCVSAPFGFEETGSLNTARYLHTATLLPNGKVLVAGGFGLGGNLTSAELYDPASGTWTATGSLATRHGMLTRRRCCLMARCSSQAVTTAPSALSRAQNSTIRRAGRWTATGSLDTARYCHTATLLRNGKVLVAGGFGLDSVSLTSAELYDPASGTWTATGSLNTARFLHTATLLPNGKVLVTGGYNSTIGYLASAELYDPASGTWTTTGSLPTARDRHTATLLPNGKVLVAGGLTTAVLSRARNSTIRRAGLGATGSLNTAREEHTATLLPNGKVLVAGGFNG